MDFLGALSFFIGLIVNGYLTIEWISGRPLSNRPMLFLGMLLIIVGVQFFSVGLLGEMLVHQNKMKENMLLKIETNNFLAVYPNKYRYFPNFTSKFKL